jgi:hypothetical protein
MPVIAFVMSWERVCHANHYPSIAKAVCYLLRGNKSNAHNHKLVTGWVSGHALPEDLWEAPQQQSTIMVALKGVSAILIYSSPLQRVGGILATWYDVPP